MDLLEQIAVAEHRCEYELVQILMADLASSSELNAYQPQIEKKPLDMPVERHLRPRRMSLG